MKEKRVDGDQVSNRSVCRRVTGIWMDVGNVVGGGAGHLYTASPCDMYSRCAAMALEVRTPGAELSQWLTGARVFQWGGRICRSSCTCDTRYEMRELAFAEGKCCGCRAAWNRERNTMSPEVVPRTSLWRERGFKCSQTYMYLLITRSISRRIPMCVLWP